jgi:hypothetical protein
VGIADRSQERMLKPMNPDDSAAPKGRRGCWLDKAPVYHRSCSQQLEKQEAQLRVAPVAYQS